MWPYCPMQSCTYYLSYIHTNVFRTAHYTIWAHVLRSISYTTWEATDERFVFSITIMFLYFFPDCSSVKLSKYILMQGDVRNQRLVQPIRGKCLKIVLIETFGDILQTFGDISLAGKPSQELLYNQMHSTPREFKTRLCSKV